MNFYNIFENKMYVDRKKLIALHLERKTWRLEKVYIQNLRSGLKHTIFMLNFDK